MRGRWPASEHRGAPLMALRPLARVATQRRCSGSALGGRRGEAGDGTRRAAASGAAGVLGTRSAWVRARSRASTRAGQAQGRARAQPGNRGEGRGKKKGDKGKEEKKRKRKKRGGEKKRGKKRKEDRGGIRGGRSRVGDRQPSGAGWDGGEEKERARFGRRKREKKRWNDDWDGENFLVRVK